MARYFIDYDGGDDSAADENVTGDILQHITDSIAEMYRKGIYRDGNEDSDTHRVSYALNDLGVSWHNRHKLDWEVFYADVPNLDEEP